MKLTLVILQLKEMKSSESMKSTYIPQNDKFGTESGSTPSNGTLWTMSKFYCSLKRDGEQIKMIGMFFSETKGTKGSEVLSLHLLSVIGTHPLNIEEG